MNRFFILATVSAILLGGHTAAVAQQGARDKNQPEKQQGTQGSENRRKGQGGVRGAGRQGGQRGGQGGGLFRLLDTDRDGILSAKEIDGALAVLLKLDVNKDGNLDAQELEVRSGGRQGKDGPGAGQRRQQDNPTNPASK